MARSSSNRKKGLNKASQGGAIWRSYLDQEVVDLRAKKASSDKKIQKRNRDLAYFHASIVSDINTSKNKETKEVEPKIIEASFTKKEKTPAKEIQNSNFKNMLGTTIDENYLSSFASFKKQRKLNDKVKNNERSKLSREALFEELSALDEYDLEIQKVLAEKAFDISENNSEENVKEEEHDLKTKNSVDRGTSLIPNLASYSIPDLVREVEHIDQKKDNTKIEEAANPVGANIEKKEIRKDTLNEKFPKRSKVAKPGPSALKIKKRKKSNINIRPPKRKTKRSTFIKFNSDIVRKVAVGMLSASMVFFGFGAFFAYTKADDIQGQAEARAMNAYKYMEEGKEALLKLDSKRAEESFTKAQEEFRTIKNDFAFMGKDILYLAAQFPIQSKVGSVAYLLDAGDLFAQSGYEASLALGFVQEASPLEKKEDFSVTDNLIKASMHLQKAQSYINQANTKLSHVRPDDIPVEFQSDIYTIQSETNRIEGIFNDTFSSLDVLLLFMGHREPKQYLLSFQNSTELRATGGFMGSYGLLTFNKGNVEEIFIDGIYNPDGQLKVKEFFVVPPKPLQYVTPHWGTRDANWFLDFPTSAEKVMWFYKQTGGPETDGVISITPLVVEKLLDIAGPIEMPEYGVTLNKDNFLELVQQEVEEDYDKELNRPKKIIADLTPILFEKLSKSDEKIKMINILHESLERKDILVYSRDRYVQDFVSNKGWSGEILRQEESSNTLNDYLSVNISNIGGWKTDKFTDTEIDSVTVANNRGELIRTVLVSRKHNGGNTPYKWYNKTNSAYIRLYTPKGSELISAEGFSEEPDYIQTDYIKEGYKIDPDIAAIEKTQWRHESGADVFEETEKTVFGGWLHLGAGDRKIIKVTYRLPLKIDKNSSNYNLVLQKQSGLDASYSGSVEELNDNISFEVCSLVQGDGISKKFMQDFQFTQEYDTEINCEF